MSGKFDGFAGGRLELGQDQSVACMSECTGDSPLGRVGKRAERQ